MSEDIRGGQGEGSAPSEKSTTELIEEFKRQQQAAGERYAADAASKASQEPSKGQGGVGEGDAPQEDGTDEEAILNALNQLAREQSNKYPAGSVLEGEETPGEHDLNEYEKFCRLGYAQKTIDIGGNKVTFRTLSQKEELEALEKADEYSPLAKQRAMETFTVALALVDVNHKPWIKRIILGESDSHTKDRFEKVLDDFYPAHITHIFNEFMKLRQEIDEKALYAGKE